MLGGVVWRVYVGEQGDLLLDGYLCRLCIAVELMPAAEMLLTMAIHRMAVELIWFCCELV